MESLFQVVCPYCGEEVEIYLEPDMRGAIVQDCEVCCNPWRLRIVDEGGDRWVEVQRADGSE
jgi:cysteine-rich CPXCG protein